LIDCVQFVAVRSQGSDVIKSVTRPFICCTLIRIRTHACV